ncbi:hypothetical protein L0222_13115 [bacterium]|nr:hypothetical protein [bacterium]
MNKKLNIIRNEIIALLQDLLQLQGVMDEFEKHYLAYVLLPSYQLQASTQMRKYLEEQYQRISKAVEAGLFSDPSEIESEVREVLKHADRAFGFWRMVIVLIFRILTFRSFCRKQRKQITNSTFPIRRS